MTKNIGQGETLNLRKDWGKTLKLAQEALNKTDETKHPKLYATRKELVDTLQYNENMRLRAEKAERVNKPEKPVETEAPIKPAEKETPKNELSTDDVFTLLEAKIPKEDVDIVKKFAKLNDQSIEEAIKDGVLKSILKEKAEERKTAEATNTGGGKRGTTKTSGDELLKKVNKGEALETDEEYDKLVDARLKEQQESR